ncbi:site-specific integrase [Xenophilus azovorans]|uniref:phage integrase family protein n=1 Tax=Xenophilus azovorans TaxID=151755 RepID=UPI001B80A922
MADGVPPEVAARTYLDVDGPTPRHAQLAHEAAVRSAMLVARRAFGGSRWRLLQLQIPLALPPSPAAAADVPSLEDWAAENGLEDWSAAELRDLYEEKFGKQSGALDARKVAQLDRLRRTRRALLAGLENFAIEPPSLSDPVAGWFPADLASRLDDAGLSTLGQLRDHIALRGRWWRQIRAYGPKKAARLEEQVQALVGVSAPPSWAALPPPADGDAGRGPMSLVSADEEAVTTWIKHRTRSPATASAYRREAERFGLWLRVERGRRLVAARSDDCADYIAFIAAVPREWVSRQHAPRTSPDWAPFAGQLSVTSQRFALAVLEAFFNWLVADGRAAVNPWLSVNRRVPDDPAAPPRDASKAFTPAVWTALIEHTERLEPDAGARMSWLLLFCRACGLRAAELLRGRAGDFIQQDDGIWLHVHGKGAKNRTVPVPASAWRATAIYFAARGLRLGATHPNTPLLARLERPEEPGDKLPPHGSGTVRMPADELEARAERERRGYITYSTLRPALKRFIRAALAASDLSEEECAHARVASTHWLRHTHATRAAEHGVPVDVLQANLGQADPRTTAIYYRAQQRRRRAAMEEVFGD